MTDVKAIIADWWDTWEKCGKPSTKTPGYEFEETLLENGESNVICTKITLKLLPGQSIENYQLECGTKIIYE